MLSENALRLAYVFKWIASKVSAPSLGSRCADLRWRSANALPASAIVVFVIMARQQRRIESMEPFLFSLKTFVSCGRFGLHTPGICHAKTIETGGKTI